MKHCKRVNNHHNRPNYIFSFTNIVCIALAHLSLWFVDLHSFSILLEYNLNAEKHFWDSPFRWFQIHNVIDQEFSAEYEIQINNGKWKVFCFFVAEESSISFWNFNSLHRLHNWKDLSKIDTFSFHVFP